MPANKLFTYPTGSYLMLRLDYLVITGDELEAKILRIIEMYVENERNDLYRKYINGLPKDSQQTDHIVEVTKDIWVSISHRLFMRDLYGMVKSENTLKRALKSLNDKKLIRIHYAPSKKYDAPEYQLNTSAIQEEFNLVIKLGIPGYQKLRVSKFDTLKNSPPQNLIPSGYQKLIPSSDSMGSKFDTNSRRDYENNDTEERVCVSPSPDALTRTHTLSEKGSSEFSPPEDILTNSSSPPMTTGNNGGQDGSPDTRDIGLDHHRRDSGVLGRDDGDPVQGLGETNGNTLHTTRDHYSADHHPDYHAGNHAQIVTTGDHRSSPGDTSQGRLEGMQEPHASGVTPAESGATSLASREHATQRTTSLSNGAPSTNQDALQAKPTGAQVEATSPMVPQNGGGSSRETDEIEKNKKPRQPRTKKPAIDDVTQKRIDDVYQALDEFKQKVTGNTDAQYQRHQTDTDAIVRLLEQAPTKRRLLLVCKDMWEEKNRNGEYFWRKHMKPHNICKEYESRIMALEGKDRIDVSQDEQPNGTHQLRTASGAVFVPSTPLPVAPVIRAARR